MEKNIKYKDSIVSYSVKGNGLPLMLVHGFGEDHSIWDKQVVFLEDRYKLIIPDIPGSGKSAMLQYEQTGMKDYAACLKAILDAENIVQSVMIGHSMGGYITLAFADEYPKSLLAFGLFHSGAYADDAEKIATRKKSIAFIRENGAAAFLATSIPGLFYNQEKSKEEIRALIQKGNNFTPPALIQYYEAMIARPDLTTVLKNSSVPVLMILGEHDKAIPFKSGLEQAHLPNHAYISILRNSAHAGMLEETGKSNNILADFLQFGDGK